jgi:hypothetical protein
MTRLRAGSALPKYIHEERFNMIVSLKCVFGHALHLHLAERFGKAVEIEALEFVNAAPIEWQLVSGSGVGIPITQWLAGVPKRKTLAFHDLQVACFGGTCGLPGDDVVLETRGIGDATVLLWPRIGTYSEQQGCCS